MTAFRNRSFCDFVFYVSLESLSTTSSCVFYYHFYKWMYGLFDLARCFRSFARFSCSFRPFLLILCPFFFWAEFLYILIFLRLSTFSDRCLVIIRHSDTPLLFPQRTDTTSKCHFSLSCLLEGDAWLSHSTFLYLSIHPFFPFSFHLFSRLDKFGTCNYINLSLIAPSNLVTSPLVILGPPGTK